MPVIRASGLRKTFGAHTVVHDVSFEVAAGETLVLLGPSGCGKTTLLKLLNRLIEPDGGTVEINGANVRSQRPEVLRRGMGYVIQQVGLLPHYTVAENIAVVPRLLGHAPAAIAARTEALLTRLHLPPGRYARQLPHQLSGGQQQRVGLARALAADPPIILMDEPFGALDPVTRAGIRREFRELEELKTKTVVLVTHDVTEAFELADRIMLLDAGRVQQLGTPRELLFRPANAFVRNFFAAERLALELRTLTLADVLGTDKAARLAAGTLPPVPGRVGGPPTAFPDAEAMLPAVDSAGRNVPGTGPALPGARSAPASPLLAAEDTAPAALALSPAMLALSPAALAPPLAALAPPLAALAASHGALAPSHGAHTPSHGAHTPSHGVASVFHAMPGASQDVTMPGPGPVILGPATSVHDALAALTGGGPVVAPLTVAELMAAFGEALQREEAAWKR